MEVDVIHQEGIVCIFKEELIPLLSDETKKYSKQQLVGPTVISLFEFNVFKVLPSR